jgi:quinol monooxygenase YgiN
MSIHLFVKFYAADQQADTLIRILQGAKSDLLKVPGCQSIEVLHSLDDSNAVVLSEIWQSKEIHDKYAATAGSLDSLFPLLKSEPKVEIFEIK